MTDTYKVAIVGGTGDLGSGLAKRWPVRDTISSSAHGMPDAPAIPQRSSKAETSSISGLKNSSAAAAGEIVVLTVPYENHAPALEAIKDKVQGKIVVDVTVPLMPPKVRTVQLPEGAAAPRQHKRYSEARFASSPHFRMSRRASRRSGTRYRLRRVGLRQ